MNAIRHDNISTDFAQSISAPFFMQIQNQTSLNIKIVLSTFEKNTLQHFSAIYKPDFKF